MPNWNTTDVMVDGPKDQIDRLYDIMHILEESEDHIQNYYGKRWYGRIVNALGEHWEDVCCRGSWDCLERVNDTTLKWWDETAWSPVTEVFEVIERHLPGVKVYWMCEEPGCELYRSNDVEHKYFDTKYILYYDEEYEYFDSDEALLGFVNELITHKSLTWMEKPLKSIDDLDKYIENSDSDDECSMAYYEYDYH